MKNSRLLTLLPLMLLMLLFTCNKDEQVVEEWLIPSNEVRDGGPGKDGIPSIDDPKLIDISVVDFLTDEDLVLAVKIGDDVRVYPHRLLDYHEIINDNIGDNFFAVNYCPLTGTGMAWNRTIGGKLGSFGVSGLLYNSNLILYDRISESNWSQIRMECVNGELIGQTPEIIPVIETSITILRSIYPEAKMASLESGFDRNYNVYPYGNYKSSGILLFGVSNLDTRLPLKERVLAVVRNNEAKTYRFEHFDEESPVLIKDNFGGADLVIVGSKTDNFLFAFESETADGTPLNLSLSDNGLPDLLIDEDRNVWNVFGEAVSGPRAGEKLKIPVSMMGFWFSFGAFYPDVEIFEP